MLVWQPHSILLPLSLPPSSCTRYVRILGTLYLRLVGTSLEIYNYLEPLFNDYRKLKVMNRNGDLQLSHVDEFIDELLHKDRSCDIILPRIQVYIHIGTLTLLYYIYIYYMYIHIPYIEGTPPLLVYNNRNVMYWSRVNSWSLE